MTHTARNLFPHRTPLLPRSDVAQVTTIACCPCPGSYLERTGQHMADCPEFAGLAADQTPEAPAPRPTINSRHRTILVRLAELESNPDGIHYLVATTANSTDMLTDPEHCAVWSTLDAMRRRGWIELRSQHETCLHCNSRYTAAYLTDAGRTLAKEIQP